MRVPSGGVEPPYPRGAQLLGLPCIPVPPRWRARVPTEGFEPSLHTRSECAASAKLGYVGVSRGCGARGSNSPRPACRAGVLTRGRAPRRWVICGSNAAQAPYRGAQGDQPVMTQCRAEREDRTLLGLLVGQVSSPEERAPRGRCGWTRTISRRLMGPCVSLERSEKRRRRGW